MKDRLNRVLCVGDVISIRSFDHASTLRVMAISDDGIYVKKCFRGRKIFFIRYSNDFRGSRCDFMIVNRQSRWKKNKKKSFSLLRMMS